MSDLHDAPKGAPSPWRRTSRLAFALTALWALITFVPPFFASQLAGEWFGVPLSVWISAQFAPIAYVLLAWLYERRANRFDGQPPASDGR